MQELDLLHQRQLKYLKASKILISVIYYMIVGSIKVNGELISHTLESQLKENGMPVSIKKGIITLDDDYTICNEGDTLTSEQCKLLKIFDIQLTQSRIIPLMCYTKGCIESLEL